MKLIDYGSSCFITDAPTSYIQSRSYRAPEVILGLPFGPKIDVWSLGCILAELASGRVLCANDSIQVRAPPLRERAAVRSTASNAGTC